MGNGISGVANYHVAEKPQIAKFFRLATPLFLTSLSANAIPQDFMHRESEITISGGHHPQDSLEQPVRLMVDGILQKMCR